MSYFKQVFILIFSLVFLYWWSNNHLHKDRKNKEYFLIEDVHYHSKPLHKVDSLLFFESNSKAEVEI
mgnify:CR=1 FL=1